MPGAAGPGVCPSVLDEWLPLPSVARFPVCVSFSGMEISIGARQLLLWKRRHACRSCLAAYARGGHHSNQLRRLYPRRRPRYLTTSIDECVVTLAYPLLLTWGVIGAPGPTSLDDLFPSIIPFTASTSRNRGASIPVCGASLTVSHRIFPPVSPRPSFGLCDAGGLDLRVTGPTGACHTVL